MKRLLPMLSQLTPMMESVVAGRMGAKAEVEQTRAAVAEISTSHTGLVGMLEDQRSQLAAIHDELRAMRALGIAAEHRAMTVDQKLAALTATVRTAAIALGGLLLLCLALLSFLLARHR